jgi:anaerobic selenocysteine-containing dehydrogenase
VVTNRIGGFAAEGGGDDRLHLHPTDAETRGITDGDRVRVRTGTDHIVTTTRVDDTVRRETVALDATTADALLRGPDRTVRIDRVDGP